MLELYELQRPFFDEGLNTLITEPVTAENGVVCVDYNGCAAFGRNSVAAHGVDLGYDGDAQLGV